MPITGSLMLIFSFSKIKLINSLIMQCVTLSIKEICFIMGLDSMLWVPIILNSYCCGNCEATVMMIGETLWRCQSAFWHGIFCSHFYLYLCGGCTCRPNTTCTRGGLFECIILKLKHLYLKQNGMRMLGQDCIIPKI